MKIRRIEKIFKK